MHSKFIVAPPSGECLDGVRARQEAHARRRTRLRRALSLAVLAVQGICAPVLRAGAQSATPAAFAFTHVNVVDVERGRVRSNQTVVISGDRIVAVGPTTRVHIPSSAGVIDGTGRFLIPGLWDMHVHALTDDNAPTALPLLVANGVTGFRDMWGSLPLAQRVRRAMVAGARTAPRFVVAGNIVDGPTSPLPGPTMVRTPEDARRAVATLVEGGAGFIKVYSELDRDSYFAIVDEAKRQGVQVAGHLPTVVAATEASAAGQRSVEHILSGSMGLVTGCATEDSALQAALADMQSATLAGDTTTAEQLYATTLAGAVARPSATRCRALARHLARNGTWVDPTLVTERMVWGPELVPGPDSLLRYLMPKHAAGRQRVEGMKAMRDSALALHADPLTLRRAFSRSMEIVGAFAREGVSLLAGTDAPAPFVIPGFSLHDELVLLVQAGLTPHQALRAATLEPARYLAATDSLGTVAPGKLADLVLLDANPLAEIGNTRKIRAVVLNGRYLDRSALDALLGEVERGLASRAEIGPRLAEAARQGGDTVAQLEKLRLR